MAKKRNTIEDYLNELYRRGMAGDEGAQLEYIQFYVMETDMPLPDEAKVWLVTLAEKGDALARRCYFAWAMSGNEGNFDWLKMEQWALALADEAPRDAYCMLGMLYEPGLPGFDDDKVAEILNVPAERDVIALIPIGYPAEEPTAPRRKPVEELLTFQ